MLNLKRLMVFREVATLGSFSLAADALSYSQPAISHHISSLEKEVGAKLLERGRRGDVQLTRVGKVMLKQAEMLLDAAATAELQLANSMDVNVGETRIGMSGGAPIVADALVLFQKALPEAEVSLIEAERSEIVANLRSRDYDLALIVEDPRAPLAADDKFDSEHLYDDPLLVSLPENHALAEDETIPIAALASESWIDRLGDATPWSSMLRVACMEAGFEPKVALSTRNGLTVQRLVAAGVGIALVSELTVSEPQPGVVVRRIDPPMWRRIHVASVPVGLLSAEAAVLVDALRMTSRRYTAGRDDRVAELVGSGVTTHAT